MNNKFDPYHIWLGIPPDEQPPNHYRLLGIQVGESNVEVIERAADGRALQLKTAQASKHSDLSQKLLNEVAAAKVYLLNPAKKVAYDALLAKETATKANSALDPLKSASETPHFAVSSRHPSRARADAQGKKRSGTPFFEGAKIILGSVAGLFLAVLMLSYFAGIDPLGWGKNSRKALDKNVAIKSDDKQPPAEPIVTAKPVPALPGEATKTSSEIVRRSPAVPNNNSTPNSNQRSTSEKALPFPSVPTEPITPSAATSALESKDDKNSTGAAAQFPIGKWSLKYNIELTAITVIESNGAADYVDSNGRKESGSMSIDRKAFVIHYTTFVEVWTPSGDGKFEVKHYYPKTIYPDQGPSHFASATRHTVAKPNSNWSRWVDSKDEKHFYERVSAGQWREKGADPWLLRQTATSADYVELERNGNPLFRVRLYDDHVGYSEPPFQNFRRIHQGSWAPSVSSQIDAFAAEITKLKSSLTEVDKQLAGAKASLIQQFDQAQTKVRASKAIQDSERLTMLNRLKQERDAFEDFDYLPFSEPMRSALAPYAVKRTKAEQLVRSAYDRQIAACVKAGQDDLSALLESEKERLLTPRLIARWRLTIGGEWTVFSDGTLYHPLGIATWETKGNLFLVYWTDPQGKKITDTCTLNPLGTQLLGETQLIGESLGPE
jgi:hypothetical protein